VDPLLCWRNDDSRTAAWLASLRAWRPGEPLRRVGRTSGKGRTSAAARDRPSTLLPFALGPVLGAGLLAVGHALGVEEAADDVTTHAGQIADTTAADEHDGVLLKVVALARNVGRHFDPVGQADAGHFAQGRVRLLGGHDLDLQAHALFLRAAVQRRML